MTLEEAKLAGKSTYMRRLQPFTKVLIVRYAKDGVVRSYVGEVKSIRFPKGAIVKIAVEAFFEDGKPRQITKANKEIEFADNKNVSVFTLGDVRADAQKAAASARKAYAQSRLFLKDARKVEDEYFTILSLPKDVTLDKFQKEFKKKIMFKWHPDRVHSSGIEPKTFEAASQKIMVALSWIENFLKTRESRLIN